MKTFRVGCNETQHGWISVQAEDEDDALAKANEYLDEWGLDSSFKVFDREFSACTAEEVACPQCGSVGQHKMDCSEPWRGK